MNCRLTRIVFLTLAFLIAASANSALCSTARLDTSTSGEGKVKSDDGKIDCPPDCSATYTLPYGGASRITQTHLPVTVRLTAIPTDCSEFSHWSGDLSGSENPKSITFSQNKSVTAHFTSKAGTLGLSEPMATPEEIPADGATPTTLTVRVTYQGDPPSVTVNLKPVGPSNSSAQTMYDDGTNGDAVAGDGTYTVQTTARPSTPIAMKGLQVIATDGCNTVTTAIKVFVTSRIVGTAQPGMVDTNSVNNTIDGQTLKVNHNLSMLAGFRSMQAGETSITVKNPAGQVVATETMSPTTNTIRIENAASGNYTYEVENEGASPQAYQIETVTGGLGIITGTVTDAAAGTNITGVRMSTDTGGASITVDGNYLMVGVAGVFTVTASSLGYAPQSMANVTVDSGGTVTVNLALTPVLIPFNVNGIRTGLLGPPRVGSNVQITILITRSDSSPHYRWLANTVPFTSWETLANWTIFNDSEPWSPASENLYVVLAHAAEVGETDDFHQGGLLFETDGNSANPIQILEFTTDLDYPQQTGTPITLSATAGGGTGTIYFKFFYRLHSGGWTAVGDWTEDGESTWTPEQAGFYTIVVHISEDNTVVDNASKQAGMTFVIEE